MSLTYEEMLEGIGSMETDPDKIREFTKKLQEKRDELRAQNKLRAQKQKPSWACFFGFHDHEKWVDREALLWCIIGGYYDGQVQTRVCKRCGVRESRIL